MMLMTGSLILKASRDWIRSVFSSSLRCDSSPHSHTRPPSTRTRSCHTQSSIVDGASRPRKWSETAIWSGGRSAFDIRCGRIRSTHRDVTLRTSRDTRSIAVKADR